MKKTIEQFISEALDRIEDTRRLLTIPIVVNDDFKKATKRADAVTFKTMERCANVLQLENHPEHIRKRLEEIYWECKGLRIALARYQTPLIQINARDAY
jgi:hypothetical protein